MAKIGDGARQRRQFITGGAVALGVAGMIPAREAKAGAFSTAVITDYQQDPDGSWNGAFSSALSTGKAIYFPPGDYRFSRELNITNPMRDVVIYGDGPDVSRLIFPSQSNGINFAGQHYEYAVDQLVVRDIGLLADASDCYNAIYATWSWAAGTDYRAATIPAAIIENVSISSTHTSKRFITGICLKGADNSRITNCHLTQRNWTAAQDAFGIVLQSFSGVAAPDIHILGCQFVSQMYGVWVNGYNEGTRIVDCSFLGNVVGVLADGTSGGGPVDWLYVSGSHFYTTIAGINMASPWDHLHAEGNYFIQAVTGNTSYCVKMTNTTNSLVTNNLFRCSDNNQPYTLDPNNAVYNYAIYADGSSKNITIDGNRFSSAPGAVFDTLAYLASGTSRIRYTNTNLADETQDAQQAVQNFGANNTIG